MKHLNANEDQMQVFVIIHKGGLKINADMNAKNRLTKVYATKDIFGIQVISNVNAINQVMLENIQIMQIVSAERVN